MSFMGVDIGTTGCKVVAFDIKGKPLAGAYREYSIISSCPGWAELDSRLVIDHCLDCIGQVASEVKGIDPITAIAVSSQGEAFTLVDDEGNFLCNAMVSFDIRSREEVKELTAKIGLDSLYQITGHSPHTMFSLFKLVWLRKNQPQLLDRATKILCFQDLLGFELTGEAVIDHSLAARTMLWDIHSKDWSKTILESVGIEQTMLAKSLPSGEIIGKIKKRLCSKLNLSEDVVVVTGGHDQPCGAIGSGVIESGTAMYATGTVECIAPVFDKLVLNKKLMESNFATYPFVIDGYYTTLAFNLTGGNLLRWFRDEFAHEEIRIANEQSRDVYELILQQVPSGPTKILVLPHFVATGTPHFDSFPMGTILGLELATTRGQFIKALLEGVTYEMKYNTEELANAGIKINEFRAIGGGAKSNAWLKIKADIMGLPIVTLRVSEAACLGAAMIAAVGSKQIASIEDAAKMWVQTDMVFEPSDKNTALYRERYTIYKNLYKLFKPIRTELAKLS